MNLKERLADAEYTVEQAQKNLNELMNKISSKGINMFYSYVYYLCTLYM